MAASGVLRSSHRRSSIKIGVLKNLANFTGKQMCQSLFINTFQDKACKFIKKETLALVFFCEFCGIFRNNFFTKYFRETASVNRL